MLRKRTKSIVHCSLFYQMILCNSQNLQIVPSLSGHDMRCITHIARKTLHYTYSQKKAKFKKFSPACLIIQKENVSLRGKTLDFKHMVSAACLLIDTSNGCHDVWKGKFEKSTCLLTMQDMWALAMSPFEKSESKFGSNYKYFKIWHCGFGIDRNWFPNQLQGLVCLISFPTQGPFRDTS